MEAITTPIVMVNFESSKYFADLIFDELTDQGVHITKLKIIHETRPNGEKYYKLDIKNAFSLLGKVALYVGSIVSDDDILDLQRISFVLANYGIKRRIFVIPFLAYGSSDRAIFPGEVVLSKTNQQLFSFLGSTIDENVFVFLDLHFSGLLNYFEGSCLRIELYGQEALCNAIREMGYDMSNVVIGTQNLRSTQWVNSYADDLGCPIVLATEDRAVKVMSGYITCIGEIIGDIKGKHAIIFNDLIRSDVPVIEAAQKYLIAGATRVDFVTSHLAITDEKYITELTNSPITKIICTNSHPSTQCDFIKNNDKFVVVDVSPYFARCLFEMLPSDRFPRLSVL
jgi:ribose-phosphate pyrophosphokinase